MDPEPDFGADSYKGSGKLKGKVKSRLLHWLRISTPNSAEC